MTLLDFVGSEYKAWCCSEYDEARKFLKSCGRPKDEYDTLLIQQAKITCEVFRKYKLD